MTAIVTIGDAANLLLPDASVDLIVTSPPYYGLRSYQDGGEHYAGQVGDESTPTEYLDALIACSREWLRVLKPSGSLFVNLGDKYGPDKSLLDLPARYAIRVRDELGVIKRAEIIWSKVNGLPESVQDRVRRSHEVVFHFVKQPRYYAAVDEIREAYNAEPKKKGHLHSPTRGYESDVAEIIPHNPLGKLPGSVWSIPTAPLRVPAELGVDHFAAYPPELVRRIILGWSPRDVCTACGEGRRPTVRSEKVTSRPGVRVGRRGQPLMDNGGHQANEGRAGDYLRTITGYACACPDTTAPATPGVVLDPFAGTGTTMLVASVHGRVGIGVDLSADYCRLAQWRTTDETQRARAAGVKPKPRPKPQPVAPVIDLPTGQMDLLTGTEWTA